MSFRTASTSASVSSVVSVSNSFASSSRHFTHHRPFSTSSIHPQAPTPPPTLPRSHFLAKTPAPRTTLEAYQRYPNHPLNAFFQIKKTTLPSSSQQDQGDSKEEGAQVSLPVSLVAEDVGKDASRRSWMAPELRRKSSMELHQLWYVLLMELNRMATKWEEIRRNGVKDLAWQSGINVTTRMLKVKKSMGRIKLVLNERRLSLLSAQSTLRSQQSLIAATRSEQAAIAAVQAEQAERRRLEDQAFEVMRRESEGAEEFSMGGQQSAGTEGVSVGLGQQQQQQQQQQAKQNSDKE